MRIRPPMTACLTCGLQDLHQALNDSHRVFFGVIIGVCINNFLRFRYTENSQISLLAVTVVRSFGMVFTLKSASIRAKAEKARAIFSISWFVNLVNRFLSAI